MKYITTSKGEFCISEIVPSKGGNIIIQGIEYKVIGKLSGITEEQASEIVDNSMMNSFFYKNYINEGFKGRTWLHSSIQSLHSLLESKGFEIKENTYIFKI